VLLFRYSALTFNGHRIHFDLKFTTEIEGYPGLVVHGPLLATLMVDLARRERPEARVVRFEFRAQRPVFDTAPFVVAGAPAVDGAGAEVWVTDPDGCYASRGRVELDE
jgi:3-methylfumaryl-CoA hydratase